MFPISFDVAANDVCGGFGSNGCKAAAVAFIGQRSKKTGFNLCRRCLNAWIDSHTPKRKGLQFSGHWFGVLEAAAIIHDEIVVDVDRGRVVAMFATPSLAGIWVNTVREYLAGNGYPVPAHTIVQVGYHATIEGLVP